MRGETGRAGKRPLRSLSAFEKISAIRRVHEGESKASVARDLSVPESTLRGWCKSEDKIRNMARNSLTPDSSEANSPLSTSGIMNNNNNNNNNNSFKLNTSLHGNHSSEDEGQLSKRLKVDTPSLPGYYTNENLENELTRLSDPPKVDYLSLMNSMAAMRPENNALLLQHLSLLGGNNAGPLVKSLLNLPSVMPHSSTVGLVENGLQYTKSNINININNNHANYTNNNNLINNNNNNINNNINNINKRHSTSAITPTQSYTRKSSPPAAEIPLTPDPASPRKTSDSHTYSNHHLQNNNIHSYNNNNNTNNNNNSMNYHYNNNNNTTNTNNNNNNKNNNSTSNQNYHQQNNQHRDVKKKSTNAQIPSLNNNKIDEALWLWLQSQKGAANFNQQDGLYASWFWQWYKQGQAATMSLDQQQQQQQKQSQQPQQQQQQQLMNGKKSPSETRALLDSILCNNNNNNNSNNNDSAKKMMNTVFDDFIDDNQMTNDAGIGAPQTVALPLTTSSSSSSPPSVQSTTTSVDSCEEAVKHGEQFFKWLNKCSNPAVSRLDIAQLKFLLDKLKAGEKNQSTHVKQKRK